MQDESGYEIAPFLSTALGAKAKLCGRTGMIHRIQIQPLISKERPLEVCSALKTKGMQSYLYEKFFPTGMSHNPNLNQIHCACSGPKFSWSCFRSFPIA